jgi:hypothetical protein
MPEPARPAVGLRRAIARLCSDAAAALDREPGLPAARLVGPG